MNSPNKNKKLNSINFTKMNGAGNDFILIDASKNKNIAINPSLIRNLCNRRRGIGADGILYIEADEITDYKLTYYNSDGSLGSLCGNGSRCSIFYFSNYIVPNKREVKFTCNDEIFSGLVSNDDEISFNLPNPVEINLDIPISINKMNFQGHFIKVGSPHLIIFWDEIKKYFDQPFDKFNLNDFGKKVRNSEHFSPDGTNVNVVNILNQNYFIRTYERGVEEETFSCGTGTASAAVISNIKLNIDPPIKFSTFGGDILEIDFIKNRGNFNKITLTGPVKINYIGSCNF